MKSTIKLAAWLLSSTALTGYVHAQSLPSGGQVVAGQAAISSGNNTVTVEQRSDRAIVNWQNFSIANGNKVEFLQPDHSSAILNRVTGQTPSTIAGQIIANGHVFLINPNGLSITSSGEVRAAGFVASTLDIANEDFMSGTLSFRGSNPGAVSHSGSIIITKGGYAALLGGTVEQSGSIIAPMGKVALGAGSVATLDVSGNHFLQIGFEAPMSSTSEGLAQVSVNKAQAMARETVNLELADEAISVAQIDGVVHLSGRIDVTGGNAAGGTVILAGKDIGLVGATIDASGAGGGDINIGGEVGGEGALTHAQKVNLDKDSVLRADGEIKGRGGKIVLWSDENTKASGILSAQGANGGGLVETSGKTVDFNGIRVDTSSLGKPSGTWLIDPYDLNVGSEAAATISANLSVNNVLLKTTTSGASGIGTPNASGSGDININAPISWNSGAMLSLDAYKSVSINALITVGGAGTVNIITNDLSGSGVAGTGAGDFSFGLGGRGFAGRINYTSAYKDGALYLNNTPYTLVYSLSDLQALSGKTGTYALGQTIDATGQNYSSSLASSFAGILSGIGNNVNNLTITNSYSNTALIGTLTGTVRDLGVGNITIVNSGSYAAGLVATSNNGIVKNSYATGSVDASYGGGGLVGYNNGGQIRNSFAGVAVGISGGDLIGGLVSNSRNGNLSDVYATGPVGTDGRSNYAGGLIGQSSGDTITDAYATGNVGNLASSSDYIGGLIGYVSTVNLTRGYASGSIQGDSSVGGLIGYGYTNVISGSYATGDVTSAANGSNIGGFLGSSGTNAISNSFALGSVTGMGGNSNVGGFVGNDATESTYDTVYAKGNVTVYGGLPEAIDYSEKIGGFAGRTNYSTFLNSYATGNVNYYGYGDYVGGFVGYLYNSNSGNALSNVKASGNVSANNATYVGGLAGYQGYSNFANVSASGVVTGAQYVGGLIGYTNSGAITGAYSTGAVTGTSASGVYAGGLIGVDSGTDVSYSHATGSVTAAGGYLGGLIGNLSYNSDITFTYATGNVTTSGANSRIGGLVGYFDGGTLNNSYATGNVSNTGDNGYTGGLIGYDYNSSLSNVYSSGYVTGKPTTKVAGLVGLKAYGTATNAYWDRQTSGQSIGALNNASVAVSGITGLNTSQFNSTSNFSGFSFSSTPGNTTGWVIVDVDGSLNNAGGAAGATRPMLASEYSTSINSSHQLALIAMSLGANYSLVGNIDASDTQGINSVWNTSNAFLPIGANGTSFTGLLDGKGYSVSGLKIYGGGNYVGLIGYNAGTITNLNLANANVTGFAYATGAIAGWNQGAISYVNTSGNVSGGGDHMGGITGVNASVISASNSGATVTSSNWSVGGVTGYNGGTITSSTATGPVTGTGQVSGGIVGYNAHGTVTKSWASGNITGQGQAAGGLAGWNEGGSINNSWAGSAISGTAAHKGGLVGANVSGIIVDAYSIGSVTGSGTNSGGLTGYNSGTVTSTYASGAVSGTATYQGGLTGWNSGSFTKSYWDTQTTGKSLGSGVGLVSAQGLGTSNFKDYSVMSGLNFYSTPGVSGWVIVGADGELNNQTSPTGARPMLAALYSTEITNAYQLQLMAYNTSANYTLKNNIDWVRTANPSFNFAPVGNNSRRFSGSFEGNGYAINGLALNSSGTYLGLFGYSTGTISNLSLNGISINSGGYTAGGLVGWNDGTIRNVSVSGAMGGYGSSSHLGGLVGVNGNSGKIATSSSTVGITASNYTVGGLVGFNAGSVTNSSYAGTLNGQGAQTGGLVAINWGGAILNSRTSGTVSGAAGYSVGGLVGYTNGTVVNASSSVNVTATGGGQVVGGLIGYNRGKVVYAYATGSVQSSSTTQSLGGLLGWNEGAVKQSFATGSVSATGVNSHTGGFAGANLPGATIDNAYALGSVTSNGNDVGGFTGYNSGTVSFVYSSGNVTGSATYSGGLIGTNPGAITTSYWDTQTSGKTNATGAGSSTGATGRLTSQLKSSLSGFSSSSWLFYSSYGLYPYLSSLGPK